MQRFHFSSFPAIKFEIVLTFSTLPLKIAAKLAEAAEYFDFEFDSVDRDSKIP